ncbi:MAG: nucleotide-binding protein [Pirellulaceae bacterium]
MAVMPIEVVEIGNVAREDIARAITQANAQQGQFQFFHLSLDQSAGLRQHTYRQLKASDFLDTMARFRTELRGYHPFLITFIDSPLDGTRFCNLFGSHRAEDGLALATTSNVADVIVPGDRMVAYVLYYLARYALSFACPDHKNHDDDRRCVFDRKIDKRRLLDSMKAHSFCDDCRRALLSAGSSVSPNQLEALDSLLQLAGELMASEKPSPVSRPTAFIGSSTAGLPIANKLQALLEYDLEAVVWNQGTVFGLGDGTLEALEVAVLSYDFGIFVFTPDDELHTRGQVKPIARDNVIFELGLFAGKLTRHRAFVVHPRKNAIQLPSDLQGISTATFGLFRLKRALGDRKEVGHGVF